MRTIFLMQLRNICWYIYLEDRLIEENKTINKYTQKFSSKFFCVYINSIILKTTTLLPFFTATKLARSNSEQNWIKKELLSASNYS